MSVLYDFVAEYIEYAVDEHGNTQYHKTTRPNHSIFYPKKDKRESYYYSLLLLFIPFHNETEQVEEGENAECAFNQNMASNSAVNTHFEMIQKMLKATGCVQKINEARQAGCKCY